MWRVFAGVSESAVSHTFRAGASISPATRARVLSAAKTLGYRPNELARTITTKRSGVVAVIIHGGMLLYYPEVLVELSRAVTQAGMRVMLFTIEHESEIANVVDQILGYQIDGAIMLNRVPAELLTTLSKAVSRWCSITGKTKATRSIRSIASMRPPAGRWRGG